jgi:lipoprotein-releasing system permease protein
MRYELFIGLRYMRARNKQFFISVISLISIAGVAVGVATVIVALSVMGGFESMIRDKMLKSEGHIIIFGDGDKAFGDYQYLMKKIEGIKGVEASAPALVRQAYLQDEHGDNQMGVLVKGINPQLEPKVTGIGEYVQGKLTFDSPLIKTAQSMTSDTIFAGIILGKGVARRLEVSEGDIVRLISRLIETPLGGLQPVIRTLVVVGLYDSGMYTYDSSLAFLSLYDAQELYETGDSADRIEIKIDNIYHADRIRRDIQMELGLSYFTMTWMEAHKDLFSAINLEKIITFIIETLIILVAAFNITSTLIMLVMDKTKEIGILKSMGATKKSIWSIFVFEGTLIGAIGSISGTLLGVFLCWSLETWLPIRIPGTVYQVDRLPAEINWYFILVVNISSLLICWLSTLYPSWRAASLRPVEALRYE